jgi:glycosyltransferase involved in cell wall biosynthesis
MHISFITSMASYPWGGSEELWHMAARCLVREGNVVAALYPAVRGWHPKMDELVGDGISVAAFGLRNQRLDGWASAAYSKLTGRAARIPWPQPGGWRKSDLVVISQGSISDGLPWLETVFEAGVPYAIIVQANTVVGWPGDPLARRLRRVYAAARRAYFVSEDNLRLFRTQVDYEGENLELIWNPLNPSTPREPLPWPDHEDSDLKLAIVGRIDPLAKGQDLALEAFADERLRRRPVQLSIFGRGPWEDTCQRIIDRHRLHNVTMRGLASPSAIWQNHHALLLPSRFEGMALVMLEALWLGRPVLATRVAGALSEIIDGENGYFIGESSSDSVVECVVRACDHFDSLPQLGVSGAERIRKRMPNDPGAVLAEKLRHLTK